MRDTYKLEGRLVNTCELLGEESCYILLERVD